MNYEEMLAKLQALEDAVWQLSESIYELEKTKSNQVTTVGIEN